MATSRPGYCARTMREGDCDVDERGTWTLTSLAACRSRCLKCARCTAISFSRLERDCSWYYECDLYDLRRPPRSAPDYVSMRIRPAPNGTSSLSRSEPAAAAESVRPLRVALATLSLGPFVAALVQWCESNTRLRRALPASWRVQLTIVGGLAPLAPTAAQAHEEDAGSINGTEHAKAFHAVCPVAKAVPVRSRLLAAARASCAVSRRCIGKTPDIRCHAAPPAGMEFGCVLNLIKWQLVSMTRFDLVLFTDADVDVMTEETEPALVRRRWMAMAHSLLRQNTTWAVANADYSAPVHGGMLLLRPSAALYAEGLAVLAAARFNYTHGFDRVGRPRELGFAPRHPDGSPASDVGAGNDPLMTSAMARNAWDFVNADADQGFFFYFFFIRHRVGAYFRYHENEHHKLLHWWTGPKPWEAQLTRDGTADDVSTYLLARAYAYLERSELRGGGAPHAEPNARALWRLRRAIEDDPRWQYVQISPGAVSTYPMW